ncbi:MAG: hypothetical protein AAF628_13265 [Planctomycetota bacterium]
MNDHDKIHMLQARLRDLDRRPASPWERPIHDVARLALELELSELGQRLARRGGDLRDGARRAG